MSEIPGQVELSSIEPLEDLLEFAVEVYASMPSGWLLRVEEVLKEKGWLPSTPLQRALILRGLASEHDNQR